MGRWWRGLGLARQALLVVMVALLITAVILGQWLTVAGLALSLFIAFVFGEGWTSAHHEDNASAGD